MARRPRGQVEPVDPRYAGIQDIGLKYGKTAFERDRGYGGRRWDRENYDEFGNPRIRRAPAPSLANPWWESAKARLRQARRRLERGDVAGASAAVEAALHNRRMAKRVRRREHGLPRKLTRSWHSR